MSPAPKFEKSDRYLTVVIAGQVVQVPEQQIRADANEKFTLYHP